MLTFSGPVRATGWLTAGAMLMLAGIACLTFVDAVGRDLINVPVPGIHDLVAIGMAFMIFVALPEATAGGCHISVSLVQFLPVPVAKALRLVTAIPAVAAREVLTWRLFGQASRLAKNGDPAMNTGIPHAPVAGFMLVTSGIAGVFRALRLPLFPDVLPAVAPGERL